MSYDLLVATHDRVDRSAIERWAADSGLRVFDDDGRSLALVRDARGQAEVVCEIWGPEPAEAEDFDERLASACLAPRWLLQVSVPYPAAKARLATARSLARFLAEEGGGAAFDPQVEALIWPKRKRRVAQVAEEKTALVRLEWFVAPPRWRRAAAELVPLLARRVPEALPRRYGATEPPAHTFDPATPERFTAFLLDGPDGAGFWYASRPAVDGSFLVPGVPALPAGDAAFAVGRLGVSFHGGVVESDERWREAVAGLLVHGAVAFGAFFACAQVEPGWVVTRANRAFAPAEALLGREHVLRGRAWQGLPPVPMWLAWYGAPYSELVRDALVGEWPGADESWWRRARRGRAEAPTPSIDERADGIAVRLAEAPLPAAGLPRPPLPAELVYRARPTGDEPGGGRVLHAARPEDRARVIPELDPARP
ncbi:MAG: hypothetical protein OEW31_02875 [Thermoleophilia bacterium]|nr:hypothetical protein [Thermoleophilia bacterium]MDH4345258.1 hypothetical protein [Thermoleophilia bacterium]